MNGLDQQLQAHGMRAAQSAGREFAMGVKETAPNQRSRRIDQYARTAQMSPGGAWCGYFVGFNLAQAGFRHPAHMASTYKARNYFLYTYHGRPDPAKDSHQAQGNTRQFFMLPESGGQAFVRRHQRQFPHYDAAANTFSYQNLPLRAGDVVLLDTKSRKERYPFHMLMVDSYDPRTGRLVTIEGNWNNRVTKRAFDLSDPAVRRLMHGFGRPAAGDFGALPR